MSEVTALITDFEKMLKTKPILASEIIALEGHKTELQKETEKISLKLDLIKSGIEKDKNNSKEEVRRYTESQENVIRGEIERMERLSEEIVSRETSVFEKETIQNKKETELLARENKSNEDFILIKSIKAELEIKDDKLTSKENDLNLKIVKIKGYLQEVKTIIEEDKVIKENCESIKLSNKNEENRLTRKIEEVERDAAETTVFAGKLESMRLNLEYREEKLSKAIIDNTLADLNLSKRKKDLDDKEKCLDAEKAQVALERAKKNVS